MKSFTSAVAALAVLGTQASAHYIFNQFTYGGTKFPVYQYIRPNTNQNSPVTDLTSNDLRCNVGGALGNHDNTIPVTAGSSFSFTSDTAVYHDGPVSMYMAKAPISAAAFDGSGQAWFKIMELGPTFTGGAATWPLAQTYTFAIPSSLPNGEYLLRIEQLAIHNPYPSGIPQFYVECAQVSVTGGGSGTPGPLVSIPGYIKGTEPGYVANIYVNFNNYTVPGPAVWSGGSSPGGGNPSVPPATPSTPSSKSSTLTTSIVASTPSNPTTTSGTIAATPPAGNGGTAIKYGQCGGIGWAGATSCVSGTTCVVQNSYYSQCQ